MTIGFGTLADAVARSLAEARSGPPGGIRSDLLLELLAARERLDAAIVAVAAEWDRERSWEHDGARSPVAWLAHRAALTHQDASSLVRTARFIRSCPPTADALDVGEITAAHAAIAARAAAARATQYREHETVILGVARSLPPAGFRSVMQYWRACADDVTGAGPEAEDAESLVVSVTFGGVGHIEGRLGPCATKALLDRLDALEPPDPADGSRPPRPQARRRAAALMRLVHGDAPPAIGLDVVVDSATLAGRPPPDPTKGCCELVGHGPVPPLLVRTLACDAAIARVVMRGRSEVLDLGRRTRLVTPALRRGLVRRDRKCVEAGCDVPAHWCDAHHIIPWTHHGPTSLDNLELRCRRHHVAAHRRLEPGFRTRRLE